MNQISDFFFYQYSSYSTLDITLEITAVIFGFICVWLSKQNNISEYKIEINMENYPTGTYIINVETIKGTFTNKIIKQ